MCDEFVDTGSVNALRNRPIPAGRSQAAAKRRVCHQGEPASNVSFEESVLLPQGVREIRTSEGWRRSTFLHLHEHPSVIREFDIYVFEALGGRADQRKPANTCADKQLRGHRDLKAHTRNVVSAGTAPVLLGGARRCPARHWRASSLNSTPTLLPLAHGSPCVLPPQATSCHRLQPRAEPRRCAHRLQRGPEQVCHVETHHRRRTRAS